MPTFLNSALVYRGPAVEEMAKEPRGKSLCDVQKRNPGATTCAQSKESRAAQKGKCGRPSDLFPFWAHPSPLSRTIGIGVIRNWVAGA